MGAFKKFLRRDKRRSQIFFEKAKFDKILKILPVDKDLQDKMIFVIMNFS